MGGTLDIREVLRGSGRERREFNQPVKQRTRVTGEKTTLRSNPVHPGDQGNARSRDIGLPALQEARTQAKGIG